MASLVVMVRGGVVCCMSVVVIVIWRCVASLSGGPVYDMVLMVLVTCSSACDEQGASKFVHHWNSCDFEVIYLRLGL